ncbi:MAG TPA: ATP-dependent DNA ligase [Kineosporiaceae bacterium]
MDLPVMPPVEPMLAKSVATIPDTGHVEPKWDGFRTIVFRDGDEVELGSRTGRPLTRYFPDVVAAVREHAPTRCVLDGEIVLARDGRLDFDALQLRLHPAASRVALLAEQTPAALVTFDVLALGDDDLSELDFTVRRARLREALAAARAPLHVTPATSDPAIAARWFATFEGAGLDGVVAKPLTGGYARGRRVMFKVKHERTADCVVAGFRWHTSGPVVGSLLLGLYDDHGALRSVGVAASFPMARRHGLLDELEPYRIPEGGATAAGHPWGAWADWSGAAGTEPPGWTDGPGRPGDEARPRVSRGSATSRWAPGKSLSFVPLRPDLVAEVRYDHLEGQRFRHTAHFRRWRPDRDPVGCTFAQLDEPVRYDLSDILG